jgi:hypothetical protein
MYISITGLKTKNFLSEIKFWILTIPAFRAAQKAEGNLFCEIGIYCSISTKEGGGIDWVWKSDCGTESNVEKEKGEASDAFKRAAVMWGIGRFLYSKKIVKLPVKERNGKWIPYSDKTGKYIYDAEMITKWCNALQ